jgi:hypothetical protein
MDLALEDFDGVAPDPDIHDPVAGLVRANEPMARAMDHGARAGAASSTARR